VPENRLLKAAIQRLLRLIGIPVDTRRLLLRELTAFEDVADDVVEPSWLERFEFNRLNRHYEPALRLARLVLQGSSLLDKPGPRDASAFLLDMNDLFQRYLTEQLRRRLLDVQERVRMRPDLVFKRGRDAVYVGDAKYKLTGSGLAHNPDFYQLLAYTTAMDLPEGVLVYCQADDDSPPRAVDVRHTGRRLFTFMIDLSGSPMDVERSVGELGDWIIDRAAGAGSGDIKQTA
jgi:5-methylcytosine-specific restriction enzyme subunit McrC